jgi:hypothetical protein
MEDTAIIWNATMLAKYAHSLFVRLICVTDLGNHSKSRLGGESELTFDTEVESLLNGILMEGAILPCPVADKVGNIIGSLKYEEEGCCLSRGRL